MLTRILTSAIGLVVFFAVFFANEMIFAAAIAVVSLAMVYEAVKAINAGRKTTVLSLILSACAFGNWFLTKYSAVIIFPGSSWDFGLVNAVLWIAGGVFCYMLLSVREFGKVEFSKIYAAGFTTLYITLFMSFIILLRNYVGRYGVFAVFLFSWITDTGAYFTGSLIGKHKLEPELSPKKTVEGAVGGIVLTVIVSAVYMAVMKHFWNIDIHWLFLVASAIGAVLSEFGDLVASAMKRNLGVKDFGWIFPGHGGMLDRFDSVVFIAPYVYFVFVFLQIGH